MAPTLKGMDRPPLALRRCDRDAQESFHYVRYKASENEMYIYADDILPRYVTAALPLDYDTVAGADKFGNLYVTRLPAEVSSQVEEDPTGGKLVGVTGVMNGAPNKVGAQREEKPLRKHGGEGRGSQGESPLFRVFRVYYPQTLKTPEYGNTIVHPAS